MSESPPMRSTESGDRARFLGRVASRRKTATVPHEYAAHPIPSLRGVIPTIEYVPLANNAVDEFILHAEKVNATVYRPNTASVPEVLAKLVATRDIKSVVFSNHADLDPVRATAEDLGLEILANVPAESVRADLAITVADAAVAGTGSILQDSSRSGSRSVSLLCRIHLAIVNTNEIVATPADVLRHRKTPADMPPNLVLTTGPSRTGDIEQILTVGAHGPVELYIALVEPDPTAS
ncbi:MAG: lactate utilization protein C [Acidimicrobiales bacterium]